MPQTRFFLKNGSNGHVVTGPPTLRGMTAEDLEKAYDEGTWIQDLQDRQRLYEILAVRHTSDCHGPKVDIKYIERDREDMPEVEDDRTDQPDVCDVASTIVGKAFEASFKDPYACGREEARRLYVEQYVNTAVRLLETGKAGRFFCRVTDTPED